MTKTILLKNISWQTAYQVLSNALGLFFNILLARKISQFEFGAYSYIFSFLAIVGLFLELGVSLYFLRKWSTNTESVDDEFWQLLSARLLLVVPMSALLLGYVFFIDRFVSLEFLLAYVYFLLDIFVQPSRIFFVSQNKFNLSFLIDGSEKIVSLGLGIILLLLQQKLRLILGAFIIGRLISIAICVYLSPQLRRPKISIQPAMVLIYSSLPLFFVSVFLTLYFRVDTLLIRYLLGVESVGYYAASYRLLDASALIPSIATTAFLPTIIHLFSIRETKKLQAFFNLIIQGLSIIALLIALCGTLYAREVITFIYGGKFELSIPVLQLLSWNAVFMAITYPLSHFLLANHQEKLYIKVLIGLFICNIVTNIFFIPTFGLLGSATATLLTEFLSVILLLHISDMRIELTPLLKIFTCGIIAVSLVYFSPLYWYINVVLTTILYFTFLFMSKVLDTQHFTPDILKNHAR